MAAPLPVIDVSGIDPAELRGINRQLAQFSAEIPKLRPTLKMMGGVFGRFTARLRESAEQVIFMSSLSPDKTIQKLSISMEESLLANLSFVEKSAYKTRQAVRAELLRKTDAEQKILNINIAVAESERKLTQARSDAERQRIKEEIRVLSSEKKMIEESLTISEKQQYKYKELLKEFETAVTDEQRELIQQRLQGQIEGEKKSLEILKQRLVEETSLRTEESQKLVSSMSSMSAQEISTKQKEIDSRIETEKSIKREIEALELGIEARSQGIARTTEEYKKGAKGFAGELLSKSFRGGLIGALRGEGFGDLFTNFFKMGLERTGILSMKLPKMLGGATVGTTLFGAESEEARKLTAQSTQEIAAMREALAGLAKIMEKQSAVLEANTVAQATPGVPPVVPPVPGVPPVVPPVPGVPPVVPPVPGVPPVVTTVPGVPPVVTTVPGVPPVVPPVVTTVPGVTTIAEGGTLLPPEAAAEVSIPPVQVIPDTDEKRMRKDYRRDRPLSVRALSLQIAMSRAALKKGSIFTHDISLENIVNKLVSFFEKDSQITRIIETDSNKSQEQTSKSSQITVKSINTVEKVMETQVNISRETAESMASVKENISTLDKTAEKQLTVAKETKKTLDNIEKLSEEQPEHIQEAGEKQSSLLQYLLISQIASGTKLGSMIVGGLTLPLKVISSGLGAMGAGKLGEKIGGFAPSIAGGLAKAAPGVAGAATTVATAAAPAAGAAVAGGAAATTVAGGAAAATGIGGFLVSLSTGISSFANPLVRKGALNMAIAGVALIPFFASLYTLSGLDPMTIIAASFAIASFALTMSVVGKMQGSITQGAIALAVMGVAIIPFFASLQVLRGLDVGSVLAGSVAMLALAGAINIVGKMQGGIYQGAAAMALMGVAIAPFFMSLRLLEGVSAGTVVAGTLAMLAVAGTISILGKMQGGIYQGIGAMAVMGVAILPFVGAMHLLKGVDPSTILSASAGILALGFTMTLLGKMQGGIYQGVGAMLAISAAIIGAAYGFSLMKGVDAGSIAGVVIALGLLGALAIGLGAVAPLAYAGAAALIAIGAAVVLVGVGMLAAGAGMMMMGSAFSMVAASLTEMSRIPTESLFKIGAALLGIGVTLALMGLGAAFITVGAVALTVVAGALYLLGAAVSAFPETGSLLTKIGDGMTGLANGIVYFYENVGIFTIGKIGVMLAGFALSLSTFNTIDGSNFAQIASNIMVLGTALLALGEIQKGGAVGSIGQTLEEVGKGLNRFTKEMMKMGLANKMLFDPKPFETLIAVSKVGNGLQSTANGVSALAASLVELGNAMSNQAFQNLGGGGLIGGLMGGSVDILTKLQQMAELSEEFAQTASSISTISLSVEKLGVALSTQVNPDTVEAIDKIVKLDETQISTMERVSLALGRFMEKNEILKTEQQAQMIGSVAAEGSGQSSLNVINSTAVGNNTMMLPNASARNSDPSIMFSGERYYSMIYR